MEEIWRRVLIAIALTGVLVLLSVLIEWILSKRGKEKKSPTRWLTPGRLVTWGLGFLLILAAAAVWVLAPLTEWWPH